MTHWILSAEADRIQDLVFRSARLREVVGASSLLTRFCRVATAELAGLRGAEVVVADGGSFTITFAGDDREAEATRFGQDLAALFHDVTGGTLTIAPVEAYESDFRAANQRSRAALAVAKRRGRDAAAVGSSPYTAVCASCGFEAAVAHRAPVPEDTANYVCASCLQKATMRGGLPDEYVREVLCLDDSAAPAARELVTRFKNDRDLDAIAADWDPRDYVGYVAADGNGLGRLFNDCSSPDGLRRLSESVSGVVQRALATATRPIMTQAQEQQVWTIPVVQLIFGGDDVFVRVPAPYCLDFAQRFCKAYEDDMGKQLNSIFPGESQPTIACAVVICKRSYPHTLAHGHAKRLLERAKLFGKALRPARSAIAFDVILGSSLTGGGSETFTPAFQAGAQPYLLYDPDDPAHGLPLTRLLSARFELRQLPRGRLSQLERLYDAERLPQPDPEDRPLETWLRDVRRLLARVARSELQERQLTGVLQTFGHPIAADHKLHVRAADNGWRWHKDPLDPGADNWRAPLPDLLLAWEFALDADKDRREYALKEDR